MKCEQIRKLLPAYLDDELRTEEQGKILAHLSTCEHCQAELDVLTNTQEVLRQSLSIAKKEVAEITISPEAWAQLRKRLEDEEQPKFAYWQRLKTRLIILDDSVSSFLGPRHAVWKTGAATMLIVALTIGLVLGIPSDDDPSDFAQVWEIAEKDPQVREVLGEGEIAIMNVRFINGDACALAGGETGYVIETCINIEERTVTSVDNLGRLLAP